MDGCVYRTKDGECDLYSEGGKFKAFCDPEHCDNIAPTNADRIRAMTDEELAKFMGELPCCPPGADVKELCYPMDSCEGTDLQVQCWINWLSQEAKEEK